MSAASPKASIGVDFGTSNTVIAMATPDGTVETVRFDHHGSSLSVFASALTFWPERAGSGLPPKVEGGPWAIDLALEGHGFHRFIQSFKTFAASRAFTSTAIFGQRFLFEDLLAAFLRTLFRHADGAIGLEGAEAVIGRPVSFAGANPDDALAMTRYREGFGRFGARSARYVYEPVGAAFSFARTLDGDATVLVADFGGGTSDFTLVRFARHAGVLRIEPLGQGGIGIAGDTFDARIIDHVVSPRLGKGMNYKSFGKDLPVPNRYYSKLSRWNELALMKGSSDMRELGELARASADPGPLEDFITLIEFDLGLALARAVSEAKLALSSKAHVEFRFSEDGIDIGAEIARADFETWIAPDLERVAATVDKVLADANVAPSEIDRVFLTGGTSFVPAVQTLFATRFGSARLVSADQFESIASGLALIGLSPDADRWSVGV